MLIEFFGLPGSGKSTLSRHVASLLRARGHHVVETTYNLDHCSQGIGRLWAKSGHVARYTMINPYRAASDLAGVVASHQTATADLAKSAFNWMFISALASHPRSPDRVTLLDQGLAQAMWSIALAARRKSWLRLVSSEPSRRALCPDMIIHIRAALPTIGERLASRKRLASRLDAHGHDQERLRRAEAIGDEIVCRFALCGVQVVEVDNDDTQQLTSCAHSVSRIITDKLGGAKFGTPKATPIAANQQTPAVTATDRSSQEQRAEAVSPKQGWGTGPGARRVTCTLDHHSAPTREGEAGRE